MNGIGKAALVITAITAAVVMAPVLILAGVLPSQTSRGLFAACSELRGARAGIVPNPPATLLGPDEVLLRIATTASTLGFGRQGEVVAAAISLRQTGLANAANPAVPDTLRYAHSTEIDTGVGALALPPSSGSAAELMTPEVSTALLMDRMVESLPAWRDTDPAAIIAELLGGTAEDYAGAVSGAEAHLTRLPQITTTSTAPAADLGFAAVAATSPPPPNSKSTTSPTNASPPQPLTPDEARAAAVDNPEASACLDALTAVVPPPAPSANPRGADLAAAAQRAVGTELEQPNAAAFVSDVCSKSGVPMPNSIPAQVATGWTAPDPSPGDLVFVDISADHGPHLVGIAVAADTMVTVLPGHSTPEWARIGPNRIVRRIEVNTL